MEYHLTSLAINIRCKMLEEKYFYFGENLAVVTLPLCDDVTTEGFVKKILYCKAYKSLN